LTCRARKISGRWVRFGRRIQRCGIWGTGRVEDRTLLCSGSFDGWGDRHVPNSGLSHVVKGMTLVGTGAKLRVLPEILRCVKREKAKTVRRIADLSFSPKAPAELKREDFEETMRCRAEVIYKDFNACDHFNIMDAVKSIRVPALILCGTDDALTPPKYSEYLHAQLQGSKLLLVGAPDTWSCGEARAGERAIEEFVTASKS